MLVKLNEDIDSAETAERFRRRDAATIARLVDHHRQPMFAFIMGMLGHREDAEDVLQEVFLRTVRSADRFDPQKASLKTWIYTIAKNCCRTVLTRRQTHSHSTLESEPATPLPSPLSALEGAEQVRLLDEALKQLPDEQRMVFLLCEVQRLSLQQAADITQTPIGTVKSRLSRGKQRLRQTLYSDSS